MTVSSQIAPVHQSPETAFSAVNETSRSGQDSQRLWFLDLMRAVAAMSVAVYHLGYFFWIYNDQGPNLWLANPIQNLYVAGYLRSFSRFITRFHFDPSQAAVALFFLVSGFVIALSLEKVALKKFAVSRFFRIFPTYWVALVFTTSCLAVSASLNGRPFPYSWQDMLLNLTLFEDWLGTRLIDGVSWSLVIEMKFYVLCALLFALPGNKRPVYLIGMAMLLLAATCLAVAIFPFVCQSGAAWAPAVGVVLSNGSKLLFMFIGVAIYRFWCRQWSWSVFLSTASLMAVLYSICASLAIIRCPEEINTPASYLGAGVIFCLIYLLRDRIPRVGFLQAVANGSYSLYIVHSLAGCAILSALWPYTHNMYLDLLLTAPIITTVAIVIHKLVEKPSIKLGKKVVKGMIAGNH